MGRNKKLLISHSLTEPAVEIPQRRAEAEYYSSYWYFSNRPPQRWTGV